MNNFGYIKVNDSDTALQTVQSIPGSRILAGGTDILPLIKDRIIEPDALIDISGWPSASAIEEDQGGGLLIGTLTPLSLIAEDKRVLGSFAALADACRLAATPQLRNMGTIGGNLLQQTRCWYYRGPHDCWMRGGQLCYARDGENENHAVFMTDPRESKCVSAHPSDPAAALLALDAVVLFITADANVEMPIADFFALPTDERRSYTVLPEGALITGIRLPAAPANRKSSYTKAMARASWAFALAGVAISVQVDGKHFKEARVALAGVAPVPFRAYVVEERISGRVAGEVVPDDLAEILIKSASPLSQNGYKVELLRAIFKQAFTDLLK